MKKLTIWCMKQKIYKKVSSYGICEINLMTPHIKIISGKILLVINIFSSWSL